MRNELLSLRITHHALRITRLLIIDCYEINYNLYTWKNKHIRKKIICFRKGLATEIPYVFIYAGEYIIQLYI